MGAIANPAISILLLLSQANMTMAQSTDKEDKNHSTTNHTIMALILIAICYRICKMNTNIIEEYLAESDTEEEDSSEEGDTTNERNNGNGQSTDSSR